MSVCLILFLALVRLKSSLFEVKLSCIKKNKPQMESFVLSPCHQRLDT